MFSFHFSAVMQKSSGQPQTVTKEPTQSGPFAIHQELRRDIGGLELVAQVGALADLIGLFHD
jgi:hypothetical protein